MCYPGQTVAAAALARAAKNLGHRTESRSPGNGPSVHVPGGVPPKKGVDREIRDSFPNFC